MNLINVEVSLGTVRTLGHLARSQEQADAVVKI